MAQVPYDSGVPSTAPDTRLPDDFQHVDANPSAFGGLLAQGAQQAGLGATKAANFFGEVAADNGANQFQDFTTKLLHGDPSKQVQQPDGSMGPDTGFLGLHGRAALDARPQAEAQIDAQLRSIRDGLQTPEQQLQFDNFSKRYRAAVSNQIGEHADTQANTWYQSVNNDSAQLALQNVAIHSDNPEEAKHSTADYINARVKSAQLAGAMPGDAVWLETIARARQDALKTQLQVISVKDPARAQAILENPKNKAIAGTEYEPLANEFRGRADQGISDAAVDRALAPPAQQQPPQAAAPGPGVANPAAVVRHFEGFRTSAYWDSNHWRVGYGSDTVTNADGSVSPVTSMTTVSRDDAERDLSRRVQQSQTQAEAAVGPQAWQRISPQARASVTSVIYNYGKMPERLLAPIQSGDAHQIALAIHNLGGDNGGVNAQRRAVEAANVVGKFGLSGVAAMRGYAPMMTMPSSVASTYHPLLSAMAIDAAATTSGAPPTWAGGLAPVDRDQADLQPPVPPSPQETNAGTPPPVSGTPQSAPGALAPTPANDPLMRKAAAFQAIENDPTLNERQKEMAYAKISRQVQAESIAQEADAKAKADLSEKTAGTYFERIENGETKDLAPQIINDQRMRYETRHALLDMLEKAAGDRNVKNYGPGYADAYRRIMLPENDPQRILDPLDLYRQGAPGGPLTMSGVGRLKGVLDAVRKSVNDAAVERTKSSMLSYANEKMTYTIPGLPGFTPDKRDPKGTMLFNSEFVPRLEAAYDAYIKAGHNPWDANSPLAKKNVDALIEQIRPQRQMAQEQLSDPKTDHDPAASAAASASDGFLPPPPRGVDWNGWVNVVGQPPPSRATGQPLPFSHWAKQLNILLADPSPRNIRFFNQAFGHAGYDGEDVLRALYGRRYQPAPEPETFTQPSSASDADTDELMAP